MASTNRFSPTTGCMPPHLHAYGGTGYDFLLTVSPPLRDAGVSHPEIDVLMIDNPRAVFTP